MARLQAIQQHKNIQTHSSLHQWCHTSGNEGIHRKSSSVTLPVHCSVLFILLSLLHAYGDFQPPPPPPPPHTHTPTVQWSSFCSNLHHANGNSPTSDRSLVPPFPTSPPKLVFSAPLPHPIPKNKTNKQQQKTKKESVQCSSFCSNTLCSVSLSACLSS